MSDLPNTHVGGLEAKLTHKIGPFPVWVYVGAGGGVILLLLRGRGAGGSSGLQAPATATDGLSGAAPGSIGTPFDYGPVQVPSANTGGFEDPPVTPIDTGDTGLGAPPATSSTVADPIAAPHTTVEAPPPDVPVDLPLLAPFDESLRARGINPATGGLLPGVTGDRAYGPGLYTATPTVATPAGGIPGGVYRAAILEDPQAFGEPALPSSPAMDTALVNSGPAGVISFATTSSSQLADGGQVVHASESAGAPADSHPSMIAVHAAHGRDVEA